MAAGEELERTLAGVISIYIEDPAAEPVPEGDAPATSDLSPPVDERWEEQIDAVLGTLWRLAVALERRSILPPAPASALRGALGGANLVMRSEILAGRGKQIPRLLPSFAFLTTLPFLDYAEALRRSEQVRELIEAEGLSS
jgi:hypothetical protein